MDFLTNAVCVPLYYVPLVAFVACIVGSVSVLLMAGARD